MLVTASFASPDSSPPVSATLPAGFTAGPVVEGIASYTLDNGLQVLLFPDDSKPTTTVNITYKVGSRHENYGETGMAHLLEHLAFKGTPTTANIFEELGKRGMRFNGSTYFDRTNYYETFTADQDALDWALGMEADRMVNAFIARKDLDSEMTVVRNEYENWENNPRLVLWGRLQSAAFDWHNYGNITIGARSDIENVDIERLRAFYQRYYQPDNAVLIIAGKFDTDKTLASIARTFGALPRPTRELPKLYTEEPVQEGERTVTVRRHGGSPALAALYHTVSGADPDSVALEAFGEIMTLAPSGRLYKALVATHKASTVEAWNFSLADPGMLIFWATLSPQDKIAPVKKILTDTLYGIAQKPITDAEVARVRTRALKDYNELLRDPEHFAVVLSESIAQGDWRLFFLQRDQWRKLTAADVQRAATAYIRPSNVTLGEYLPENTPTRAKQAPKIDVEALVRDYRGDEAIAAGESFDASTENLEARTKRTALSNGMKLALLPKKTRGEAVRFNLRLRWGNADALKNLAMTGRITADMLSMGTAQRNRQAFEDEIDRLQAQLDIGGDAISTNISGETTREHLPELLALAAEALRSPAFPKDELDKLVREKLTSLQTSRSDPQAIATRALRRYTQPFPKGDVRAILTFEEEEAQLKALTIDGLKKFHQTFYGAQHGELAVVGDFDAEEIRALSEKLFGAWKSKAAYARVDDPYQKIAPTVLRFETPDKANAFLMGRLAVPINDQDPDFAALLVANQALGSSPEARLPNRIRTQDGLSYSVGSALQPAALDANSRFVFYAIFAPQNLARVQEAFRDVLTDTAQKGLTAQEIADAQQSLLQERHIARAQDAIQASSLTYQLYLKRTWKDSAQLDAEIAAVTPEHVAAALKKYLIPENVVYAVAGDFASGIKN
ncbi:MAG: insulinase family protein [Proteobacteria bacterium]|nr:insulinase family protein [Pseudomonadota bacterium]MCL2308122.1 insulinase family protein [Pseudomonadota bacterium]